MKKIFTLIFAIAWISNANGQQVQPINSPIEKFVKQMVSGDQSGIFNVEGHYNAQSLGGFSYSGASSIGLDSGLVLSTGLVEQVFLPNMSSNNGTAIETVAMVDSSILSLLSNNNSIYDLTYFEFDYVPSTNMIDFSYVFASEEYPEYVGAGFNDVFGFFVSGPGIDGEQNIAVLPDNGDVVSINSINNNTNSEYYLSNLDSTFFDAAHFTFDGLTVPLTAQIALTPFDTFHIKIVIADIGDAIYDSAVFLKANSFESKPLVFDFGFGEGNYEKELFEDSTSLLISASLPVAAASDITYHFAYAGDAEIGVDYIAPESFTFKKGKTDASFKIKALKDENLEEDETIQLIILETKDTLTVTIHNVEEQVVGQKELSKRQVKISPNPATDLIAIPDLVNTKSVSIYNLTGTKMKFFTKDFQNMNVADLPKGLYVLRVETNTKTLVSKFRKD